MTASLSRRYEAVITTDRDIVQACRRLRHRVFTTDGGAAAAATWALVVAGLAGALRAGHSVVVFPRARRGAARPGDSGAPRSRPRSTPGRRCGR